MLPNQPLGKVAPKPFAQLFLKVVLDPPFLKVEMLFWIYLSQRWKCCFGSTFFKGGNVVLDLPFSKVELKFL
jgi:hypothetical protein